MLEEAQAWVTELVQTLRRQAGDPDLKVVLLVDSVEQIRGVGSEAKQVHDSVVNLFSAHAVSLAFRLLHVVYTIPPFLIALEQNLGRTLGGHAIVSWPNLHVRHADGREDPAGLAVMEQIIDRRHAGWRDLVPPATLRRLASCAGGDLRDFFRLIGECVIALRTARLVRPDAALDDALVRRVEEQLRNEMMPTADPGAAAGREGAHQGPGAGPVGGAALQPRHRSLARPRHRAHPPPEAAPLAPTPFPLDPTEQALVDKWFRLRARATPDRGRLLAAQRAHDALLRRGHIAEARAVAQGMVADARRLAGVRPPHAHWLRPLARLWSRLRPRADARPEALRDLSVSLDNVGRTDQALRDWAAASGAFAESLDISRRLLARLGETPEALRDLSISLDNVGRTDQALGQTAAARVAFSEGLEIAERLATALPDLPEYRELPAHFRARLVGLEDGAALYSPPAFSYSRVLVSCVLVPNFQLGMRSAKLCFAGHGKQSFLDRVPK